MHVIGITRQSCSFPQCYRSLQRNGNPLSEVEAQFWYVTCERFQIDAGAMLGMWGKEGGLPYGQNELQRLTRCPLNIRSFAQDTRPKVAMYGGYWQAYESYQLGWHACLIHLKNVYGWSKKLYTLEQIVPVFAPASDGNSPDDYIQHVYEVVNYIKAN